MRSLRPWHRSPSTATATGRAVLAAGIGLATAIALSGCGALLPGPASSDATGSDRRACGIMPGGPDAAVRWADRDAPLLREALEEAGFTPDIRVVAAEDYATTAGELFADGCRVLLLTDRQGAAVDVSRRASGLGIPVLAYDRPVEFADATVGFDEVDVGTLAGEAVADAVIAAGIDPAGAVVVTAPGDPSDARSARYTRGAEDALAAAGITPARRLPGVWDEFGTAVAVTGALSTLDGGVDAVWAADDANAAGAVRALAARGQQGVVVVGQGATLTGLRGILLGHQTATVYTPVPLEVSAAVDLATALARGDIPDDAADPADDAADPVDGAPFVAVPPQLVGADQVADVVSDGAVSVADLCAGEVAAACERHGLG